MHLHIPKRSVDLAVASLLERVEVVAHGAAEQERLLRNHANLRPQESERKAAGADSVNKYPRALLVTGRELLIPVRSVARGERILFVGLRGQEHAVRPFGFDQAEERLHDGRLAGSRSSHNGTALAGSHMERQVAEDGGQVPAVARIDVAELDVTRGWPRLRLLGRFRIPGLLGQLCVRHEPLSADHLVLHLGGLAHHPLEETGKLQDVHQRRPEQRSVDGVSRIHVLEHDAEVCRGGEQRDHDQVQLEAEPPVQADEAEVGPRVRVDALAEGAVDLVLQLEGSDHREALQHLCDVGEDRGSRERLDALDRAAAAEERLPQPHEVEPERQHDDQHDGVRDAGDRDRPGDHEEALQEVEERHRKEIVGVSHILAESIQNSAERCPVEERHGRFQQAPQRREMQLPGSRGERVHRRDSPQNRENQREGR
mmetsp:Transcript_748/g.3030  ORF Transcript_748/g.3030 Transcript_748/m.3030 type:complete len:427 (-) Transcript_748:188-1468(-)